ncbi:hypothetical protein Avbf_18732 [Armadillidium vulgare]|nr:hypothetical protein Avbf_18732 [Armadillidium vulgare]
MRKEFLKNGEDPRSFRREKLSKLAKIQDSNPKDEHSRVTKVHQWRRSKVRFVETPKIDKFKDSIIRKESFKSGEGHGFDSQNKTPKVIYLFF